MLPQAGVQAKPQRPIAFLYPASIAQNAIVDLMQVTLEIPDTYAAALTAAGKDPARVALEALMVEGYRTRRLSEGQIKRTLGYGTRMQVHDLLKEHGVPLNYGVEELQQDIETIRKMEAREVSSAA